MVGVETYNQVTLISTLNVSESIGCSAPRKRALGTNWVGGGVGPRARSDCSREQKNPCPCCIVRLFRKLG
jgi:hypothetical protein